MISFDYLETMMQKLGVLGDTADDFSHLSALNSSIHTRYGEKIPFLSVIHRLVSIVTVSGSFDLDSSILSNMIL